MNFLTQIVLWVLFFGLFEIYDLVFLVDSFVLQVSFIQRQGQLGHCTISRHLRVRFSWWGGGLQSCNEILALFLINEFGSIFICLVCYLLFRLDFRHWKLWVVLGMVSCLCCFLILSLFVIWFARICGFVRKSWKKFGLSRGTNSGLSHAPFNRSFIQYKSIII